MIKIGPQPEPEGVKRPSANASGQTDLDLSDFPHPPKGGGGLRTTLPNVKHLLRESGVAVGWDVIKKRMIVTRDGSVCSELEVFSLAAQFGMQGAWLPSYLQAIAADQPINPVADWINSRPWDGKDRLQALLATVVTTEDYPSGLKDALLHRWLMSATAAAILQGQRFSSRGVLTLQGGQGIGKTSWIAQLVPAGPLRDSVVKRDHHMDGGSKDSILGAVSHWIAELGELDSSFRKDVARLKGFLTNDCDKVRPPYGRSEVALDRRTVFAATVNDEAFLVDQTGNSRFWTIAVERLDYKHDIDMQQVFAQLAQELSVGQQWWLTEAEDQALAKYNLRHRAISAVAQRINAYVDLDAKDQSKGPYMTALEVLAEIGLHNPNNMQCRECGAVLRELFGAPKRVQGRDKWRVPKAQPVKARETYPEEEF